MSMYFSLLSIVIIASIVFSICRYISIAQSFYNILVAQDTT